MSRVLLTCLAFLFYHTALSARADGGSAPVVSLQLSQEYFGLTEGYGHWNGSDLQAIVSPTPDGVYRAEVSVDNRFGEEGAYFTAGTTQVFSPLWYASLDLASSDGGSYFPKFRGDAFLYRKWLDRQRLVTNLGLTYAIAKDPHRNLSPAAGFSYYFEAPFIVEGGIRWNFSQPDSVFSYSAFAALTYGTNRVSYLVGRVGLSREAYQTLTTTSTLVDFPSREASLTWKKWVIPAGGFLMAAEYYGNPFYQRWGGRVGLFGEF